MDSKTSISLVKKTDGYREREEQKRADLCEQLAKLEPGQIVYADESGMDSRDEDYGYGYNPRGERIYGMKSGKRSGRDNMIAAWSEQQLIAPFTIEGAVIGWSLRLGWKIA